MIQTTPEQSRFNWMLPLCAAFVVIAVYLSMAFWAEGSEFFISLLLVAPVLIVVSIALVVYALVVRKGRQRRLTLLCSVAALWVSAAGMFLLDGKYDFAIRTSARWLIWSDSYKAEVLAQPLQRNGNFKHIDWEDFGFAGVGDETAYLVYDPSDSLSGAANSGRVGKFDGMPCAVPKVNRLEKHWYIVMFYADQDWNHCD
jgi:hypothetical protein